MPDINPDTDHTLQPVEVWRSADGNQTKARGVCACGEVFTSKKLQNRSTLPARRQVEDQFLQHRDYALMHIGLFEDLP